MKSIANASALMGGGGGGGHIIENSEGTELTQRSVLQVTGSLIAEDDATNQKTIITDGQVEIEYDDWNELTKEEQAAIPKALILNAPDPSTKVDEYVEVTSDGTKTVSQLLDSLYALIDSSKISSKSTFTFEAPYGEYYHASIVQTSYIEFSGVRVVNTGVALVSITLKSSGSTAYQAYNTFSSTNIAGQAHSAGLKYRVTY